MDIAIYERLARGGAESDASFLDALEALARLPFDDRIPHLAFVLPLLAQADVALRLIALRLLAGARGGDAMEAIARALDDEDASVRLAAVQALATSAESLPARFAHALFHPRLDVRQAALDALPRASASLSFHLLADVHLDREIALAPAHPSLLPAMVRFFAEGRVTRPALAGWLLEASHETWKAVLAMPRSPVAGVPVLQTWLDVLIEESLSADVHGRTSHVRARNALIRIARMEHDETERLVLAETFLAIAHARGDLDMASGACIALLAPALLLDAPFTRDARLAALEARLKHRGVKVSLEVVERFFASDLPHEPTSELDLHALACLLTLVDRQVTPGLLGLLLERYGEPQILRAFVRDPMRGASLFVHTVPPPRGSKYLLMRVLQAMPEEGGLVLALSVYASKSDRVEMLDDASPEEAAACAWAIDELRMHSGFVFTPAKLDRTLEALAKRFDAGGFPHLVARFIASSFASDELESVLDRLMTFVSQEVGVACFVDACAALGEGLEALVARLHSLRWVASFEVALAATLRADLARIDMLRPLANWAFERERTLGMGPPAQMLASRTLSDAEVEELSTTGDLEGALKKLLSPPAPLRRLVQGLLPRAPVVSIAACVALLGASDDLGVVARLFDRFAPKTREGLAELDAHVCATWEARRELPLLGHIWLWRFERHLFQILPRLEEHVGDASLIKALSQLARLPSPTLRREAWHAVGHALTVMWRRQTAKFRAVMSEEVLRLVVPMLDTDVGFGAAKILMAAFGDKETRIHALAVQADVVRMLADVTAEVREELRALASSTGLAIACRAPREAMEEHSDAPIAGLEEAMRAAKSSRRLRAQDAAIALVQLGDEGVEALLSLLAEAAPVVHFRELALALTLIPLGPDHMARAKALAMRDEGLEPELAFALAIVLVECGESSMRERARELAAKDCDCAGWVSAQETTVLFRVARFEGALQLIVSPHPHVYMRAVEELVGWEGTMEEDALQALRRFLAFGPSRGLDLRERVAATLVRHDDRFAMPFVLGMLLRKPEYVLTWADKIPPAMLLDLTRAVLLAGLEVGKESAVLDAWTKQQPCPERDLAMLEIIRASRARGLRLEARAMLAPSATRLPKLQAIAEVFAWGTLRGLELMTRHFRFLMTTNGELGFTHLRGNDVHITVHPILARQRDGKRIVEALILHELGHHVHHSGPLADRVWDAAVKAGKHRLLNLVMDEHLERNLRARDAAWGDRLKVLAAWAFRHEDREFDLDVLVRMLGGRVFAVLSRAPLSVARDERCVRLNSGDVLDRLDAMGHSFARFMRALRMGLGDRHDDAKVREALALFDRRFRALDIDGLAAIAAKLERIFGHEIALTLGMHGPEEVGLPDGMEVEGEGIEQGQVDREVKRILEAPSRTGGGGSSRPGELAINVGANENFPRITKVERVAFDAAKHAACAAQVRRHALRLRQSLEALGLARVASPGHTRGYKLARQGLLVRAIKHDPRMLMARHLEAKADLHLVVLIDCSGSMAGSSMERAQAFGTLVLEASRGVPGIDAEAFGFTHMEIWDAGNADRPAVTSLEADGGNNDAAALDFALQRARVSKRRARLVVMISDGLPTECSVSALRGVVQRAGKQGVACAQVAVRPLEEVCFPHYVVIDDASLDEAVSRFGAMITTLVQGVLR